MRNTFLELNQANVIELQKKHIGKNGVCKLTVEDLILIRRIGDFIISSKTVTVIMENEVYHWVKYDSICEDLPMIFPSLAALKKRVEKLSELGILENKVHRVKKDETSSDGFESAGCYSVLKLSKDAKKLFDIPEDKNEKEEYPYPPKGVNPCTPKVPNPYPPKVPNPCTPKGGNKEYQENNTKKIIPPIKESVENLLSAEEEKELQAAKVKAMKNIFVSRAVAKNHKTSDNFIETIIMPSIKKHGFKSAVDALKRLYDCAPAEIYSISAVYYSKLPNTKEA